MAILSPYHTGRQGGYFPPLSVKDELPLDPTALEAILKSAPSREVFWLAARRLLSNDNRRTA